MTFDEIIQYLISGNRTGTSVGFGEKTKKKKRKAKKIQHKNRNQCKETCANDLSLDYHVHRKTQTLQEIIMKFFSLCLRVELDVFLCVRWLPLMLFAMSMRNLLC